MSGALISCQLSMPGGTEIYEQVIENAPYATQMALPNSRLGQTVVVCGAGPSLNDSHQGTHLAHEVWACNSALPLLMDRGVRVTHGFCIDQYDAMLAEWDRTFDVEYLLASSVHPDLVKHLASRRLTFFHNHIGLGEPGYEDNLYDSLYTTSIKTGHGLNSVPRAVCLALAMGFSSIIVYGADCAAAPHDPMPPYEDDPEAYGQWMDGLVLYADGRTAGRCFGRATVICEAVIDGNLWHTRPDMVISAVHLLELGRQYPGRITFVGDTLVNAIRDKDEQFMALMPRLSEDGQVQNIGNASLPHLI